MTQQMQTESFTGNKPVVRGAGGTNIPGLLDSTHSHVTWDDIVVLRTADEGVIVPLGCVLTMDTYRDALSRREAKEWPAGTRFWLRRNGDASTTSLVEVRLPPSQ